VGVSLALERLNVWLRKKTVKEVFACGEDRKRRIKKQTTKHMLRDIDGVIHPGQLLAIMGGSGMATAFLADFYQSLTHAPALTPSPRLTQEAERPRC
jgi:ABC-type polysaccharide/polyol phosphate transport system ATPase subunit